MIVTYRYRTKHIGPTGKATYATGSQRFKTLEQCQQFIADMEAAHEGFKAKIGKEAGEDRVPMRAGS